MPKVSASGSSAKASKGGGSVRTVKGSSSNMAKVGSRKGVGGKSGMARGVGKGRGK